MVVHLYLLIIVEAELMMVALVSCMALAKSSLGFEFKFSGKYLLPLINLIAPIMAEFYRIIIFENLVKASIMQPNFMTLVK